MTKLSEEVNSLFNIFIETKIPAKIQKTINSANNTKKI